MKEVEDIGEELQKLKSLELQTFSHYGRIKALEHRFDALVDIMGEVLEIMAKNANS